MRKINYMISTVWSQETFESGSVQRIRESGERARAAQHGRRTVAAPAMRADAARKIGSSKGDLQSAAEAGATAMGDMATGKMQSAAESEAAAI